MPERYVAVELTKEECEAVHEVCDLANVMLRDLGSAMTPATKSALRARINTVRYKMGIAAELFRGPNIILPDKPALSLQLAERADKKN